ncbi:MAG TPA: 50S ribosomal protein L24, partial [Solirubrobacterales bacterium]
MRIRRDDQVLIISGKDRGKSGKVLRTDPKKSRVFVEGLNIIKRHEKPRSTGDMATASPGGIVE